jgi:hypothetical protein
MCGKQVLCEWTCRRFASRSRPCPTAQAYQALFQRMLVLDLVPAWFSNRIKRLVKAPKRYLVEVDLLIETASGQLIGIEIKAAAKY